MVSHTKSYSITEVKSVVHTHTWNIHDLSHIDNSYVESELDTSDDDVRKRQFRVRLLPRGTKDSNVHFTFFQVFSQSNLNFKAKFTITNAAGVEIPVAMTERQHPYNGHFEYVRRTQLLAHALPEDVIKIVLKLTIIRDTKTRAVLNDPSIRRRDPSLNTLSANFEDHLLDEKFTDFTIRCHGDCPPIKCHRFILWSRSPVFQAMLDERNEECQRGEVVFQDIDHYDMKHFIHYIYTGRVPHINNPTIAVGLLQLAVRFDVSELKGAAEDVLQKVLDAENVSEILQLADKLKVENLKKACIRYLMKNAPAALETSGWKTLSTYNADLVAEILGKVDNAPPAKRRRLGQIIYIE
uniref:BTB domain-containing protein n=1 Tax=Panagrellus redivivus TaxID=6233 RepID=A0A7E4V3C2_PANRE